MKSILTGLGVMMTIAEPGVAQTENVHPVRLLSERQGDAVLLTVVGDSATSFAGEYALEVTGGGGANVNRSVQRGSVTLGAHQRVVPVRLVLADAAARGWRATLHVRATGTDTGYDEVAASE